VRARYLCAHCYFLGTPAKSLRGSPALELVLWLCLAFPGAAYAWWRSRGSTLLCRRCGGMRVVPEMSAEASSVMAAHPELPDQSLGTVLVLWRTFWAVPLVSGIGIVALFAVATVAPTVGAQVWFNWLIYVVAAPIVGHSLWSTVHVVRFWNRRRR
jgi:hypothetical protein